MAVTGNEKAFAVVTLATYIKPDTRTLLEKNPKSLQSFFWKKKIKMQISKNIQATPAVQFLKNKWPNQKMGQRFKQTFLQRRHTDGYQTHEKMINITHQRNANQNHNEVPLHASQDGCYPKV